ncbi:hypothetical protein Cgig2_023569 [Carnegiea gigantea]|uniref:Aminotransferase-like plant mobile domain-containing protein n=1 Tax=Carnegiea gigantea TaxID=171969 RepID=A0A9Q1GR39_9CARY|nr:hypothetical protein Cgig2_023569 [Carnegiea gigantea]
MQPDQDSPIPQPGILSPLTDAGARGWSDYQAIFDELGVATGQRTETFLAAFLSCWLCTFILPIRDAGCIHPGTFSIASLMASGVGYCLPAAVLVSIYKGLNELSHSSHPGRGGATFLLISFTLDNLVMEHYCPDQFSRQFGFYQDVPTDLDFDNLPHPEAILYHHMLMCYGTSPHASGSKRKRSDLSDTNISKDEGKLKPKLKIVRSGKPVEPFIPAMEDGSSYVKIPGIDVGTPVMPIPAIPIQSFAPLPQDELPVGVCEPSTRKVIELPPEGVENIMDILDAEPNPVECMGESDDVNFKEGLAHIPLPSGSQCFPSVGHIPSFGKDLFDSRSGLVNSQGVCPPDDDEVESILRVNAHSSEVDKNAARVLGKAIIDKVCRTPFDGLPSLRGDFDSLYATILQRGVDVIPLESKVKGLIRQACDFNDLQQSYSGQISVEVHNNCRMKVQGKFDEASHRLNTEGTHYEAKAAKLKHVESRRQELLKKLQLLEDQQKELSSQVAANEHLLQEAEREVIDLQCQIEVLNATEVMDAATKASLEKAEAYIKESFEDLKNFQWDP